VTFSLVLLLSGGGLEFCSSFCLPLNETISLYSLYNSTQGDQWNWRNEDLYGPRWDFTQSLFEIDPCEGNNSTWQGLVCCGINFQSPCPGTVTDMSECHVLDISLPDYRLSGTLPCSICDFPSLQILKLGGNLLRGMLPDCWASSSELRTLSLPDNSLNSSLPHSLYNISKLSFLSLVSNSLTGHLSPLISQLSELHFLALGHNRLSGSIPHELGQVSSLEFAELDSNQMTGSLSLEIGSLKNLKTLSITQNSLGGSLPPSLGNLIELRVLRLAHNLFTNSLPSEIGLMSSLAELSLSHCSLTGSLPSEIGSLTNLQSLALNDNSFTKHLPTTLSQLNQLRALMLHRNHFIGSLSSEFGHLTSLEYLYLHFNRLTGTLDPLFWQASNLSLSQLDLSYNLFSHHIPSELFKIPQLEVLYLSSNCLHGDLPNAICQRSETLSAIYLNALAANPKCPHTYHLLGSDIILGKAIGGTLPSCLWNFKTLTTFQFSGNAVHGTLSDLSPTTPLINLQLSHNELTGTIPRSYRQRRFLELDLSYNKLSGDCDHFVSINQSVTPNPTSTVESTRSLGDDVNISQMKLNLIVNRLSGSVSKHLQEGRKIKILEGNIFSCDDMSSVTHDPYYNQYDCGSSVYNVSLYSAIVAIACVACVILLFAVVVFANKSSGSATAGGLLPNCNLNFCWESLGCRFGSSSFLGSLLTLWRYLYPPENFFDAKHRGSISAYLSFYLTCISSFTCFVCFGLFLFLPFYILKISSHQYTSHQDLYAWSFTVAYSTGLVPGLLLCSIWMILLFLALSIFHIGHVYRSYQDKANIQERVTDVRQKRPKSRPILIESSPQILSMVRQSLSSVSLSLPLPSPSPLVIPWFVYSGFLFLVNSLVIFSVHGLYVYLLYRGGGGGGAYRMGCQLMLTFFNILWNNSVIPATIQLSRQDLPYYVFLRTWISIWNLVITPVLVTGVLDAQCLQVGSTASLTVLVSDLT
jgi:Leucine-rich repeat (LRR) protein